MIEKKISKVAKDTNNFLKNFFLKQKKSNLIAPMRYGMFP